MLQRLYIRFIGGSVWGISSGPLTPPGRNTPSFSIMLAAGLLILAHAIVQVLGRPSLISSPRSPVLQAARDNKQQSGKPPDGKGRPGETCFKDGRCHQTPAGSALRPFLSVGLPMSDPDGLYLALLEVSDPLSPRYGQHLSQAEVRLLVRSIPRTSYSIASALHRYTSLLRPNQKVSRPSRIGLQRATSPGHLLQHPARFSNLKLLWQRRTHCSAPTTPRMSIRKRGPRWLEPHTTQSLPP